jgi:hypothetical protein
MFQGKSITRPVGRTSRGTKTDLKYQPKPTWAKHGEDTDHGKRKAVQTEER